MNMSNKDRIIKALSDGKKTIKEMALDLHITQNQVKFLIKAWSIEMPKSRKYERVPMPEREELLRMYQKHGSTQRVAVAYAVGINTVVRWMKKRRIPMKRINGMTEKEKLDLMEYHIESLKI